MAPQYLHRHLHLRVSDHSSSYHQVNQRISVPAFGEWDGKVGLPDYSIDFSKIRENRRQNKSRVSLGNEDELNHITTNDQRTDESIKNNDQLHQLDANAKVREVPISNRPVRLLTASTRRLPAVCPGGFLLAVSFSRSQRTVRFLLSIRRSSLTVRGLCGQSAASLRGSRFSPLPTFL
ncbi:hypothetical protein KSP39_PZI016589 [Platanthera zijinensis]|uniref:RIN4 pathogenic type III effector avirulence factor Avr cleavage site domain-containing protein n=1 Tax=Platanthera zijinensis TaxID=2320716 RepID=A0AAP0G151_9ASPA